MYIEINGAKHPCSRRIVKEDTIKFLSVTPAPEEISGTIKMCRDDDFLLSEDNADLFERKFMSGTVLVLTNQPEPQPEPEPEPIPEEPSEEDDTAAMLVDHEYRLTLLELGLTE